MFYRVLMLLFICALLHFRGFECALVIKPENVAAVSGEPVALHCASDVSAGNIIWSTTDPGSSIKEQIYNNILASRFSSYISVSDREDGNCSLNINASLAAAKRYICTEGDTGEEASAELIVMEGGLQCNSTSGSALISCFTVSAGNWAPVVKCYQWKPDVGLNVLQRNLTSTVDNNVTTRTWIYTSKKEWFLILCETAFEESGRPNETSATNIPKYFNQTFVYNGTCVPHSGATSNSSSAGCPECSTGSTTCPVTTAANCTECPTGATTYPVRTAANCTECPTGATTYPVRTAANCTECPTGATPCPVTTAANCTECPTGATPCPVTTAANCIECPTGATPCPVTTAAKCQECPAGATASPVTIAAKCPKRPTGATTCPVTTAAKCPECPMGATGKCPECPRRPAACPACREGSNNANNRMAVNVNYPARDSARKVAAAKKCPECPAAAAECPVGACCIASLVVICVLVVDVIGYAVYKWKRKKTVQYKSPEVVVEFKIPDPRKELKGSSKA